MLALFDPIQGGLFRGCSRWVRGAKNAPPSLPPLHLSHISNDDEIWHNYNLPKEDKKIYMNHVTHLLSSAGISIFSSEITIFCYIKKYRHRFHFHTSFLILLTCIVSLKIFLINLVTILMMSEKIATPLKIKVFLNIVYDVIIYVHYVTSKTLSRDSNYIVDLVTLAFL